MASVLELESLTEHIARCRDPEDLFGPLSGSQAQQLDQLKQHYRKGVTTCHPDGFMSLGSTALLMAEETFKSFQRLYALAQEKVKNGIYGIPGASVPSSSSFVPTILKTRKHEYSILSHLADGDYSSVYLGEYKGTDGDSVRVAIKIVADEADNDLMEREQKVLQRIKHKHVPVLVETFRTSDGLLATVMEYIDGFDLTTIRQRYPSGVPQAHVSWIFKRLLSGLNYLHGAGVFHGNLTPDNILVRPRDHNAFIIDYTCSVQNPGPGDKFVAATDIYTAPEAYRGLPPIEASDLYSLGKCMIFLLGGDIRTNVLPKTVDSRFAKFILSFVEKNPKDRAQEANQAWHQLSALRTEIFGDHHFLEFVV